MVLEFFVNNESRRQNTIEFVEGIIILTSGKILAVAFEEECDNNHLM